MLQAYIYDGVRTPFGRQGGGLAHIRPDDLLAVTIRELVARKPALAEAVEDVVVGCANQAGEDSRCVARHAALASGLPVSVGGTVIQRNCGSGLGAIASAAHAITSGEGSVMIAGGVESMSRAPFVVAKSEQAFGKDFKVFDSAVGARFPNPAIEATFGADTMPKTADNLAMEYDISRDAADAFALRSQQLYAKALKAGSFGEETCEVAVPVRRGPPKIVSADEHPRPATTMEDLSRLRPLHAGGVTTAGNASGINDGAVALVVGGRDIADKLGWAPQAHIRATAIAGVEPRVMGIGPVPASKRALDRAGLSLQDMDVIEINEAFAAQAVACMKGLGLADDDARVNRQGGAIAIGHPLGASGARLALTALRQLQGTGGKYALVSMCIGVGQGIAMVIERV